MSRLYVISILVTALCITSIATAETPRPAALVVKIADIDLGTKEGVDRLTLRMVRKIRAICGSPSDAGLTYANTGGGINERAACIEAVNVEPGSHPAVMSALARAKAKA